MDTTNSSRELHLTVANEDYLECMVRIESEEGETNGVRSVDIAQRLGVSKASVNKAVSALKASELVEQSHYGKVVLTDRGREVGTAIWYRHRLIRTFLVQELGVEFERADSEACMMEHALSEDTMNRWLAYLEKQGISVEEERDIYGYELLQPLWCRGTYAPHVERDLVGAGPHGQCSVE